MPTITQLKYILSVSRTKHFGRAAKECHVSQPSLSAQIQKVEEELDIIIFDRSKKPIITTQNGLKVIEQAKLVLTEHKKFFDIKNDEGALSGHFHLGIIPTLASYTLPLFIESFSQKYPNVTLKVSEYKTEDIIKYLYDDELDAGLLVTPLYDNRLIERCLFYEPFSLFVSNDHELIDKKFIKESEINDSPIWLLEEGHCFRDQVIKVCSFKNENQVLENINFAGGSLETLINLIRRGKGCTLLPHLATINLTKKEKENNLKKFNRPVPTREVSLVSSRSFLKQDIIDALEAEILNHLPKELKSLKKDSFEVIDI